LTLSPGMFVNVIVDVNLGKQLAIPVSGVLQSGTRQIVFVDRRSGYQEPREVQLGPQANDEYIVLKGLHAGERVVTSANFLIDSESQLQAAISSYATQPLGAATSHPKDTSVSQSAVQIDFSTEPQATQRGKNLYRVRLFTADGSPVTGAEVS